MPPASGVDKTVLAIYERVEIYRRRRRDDVEQIEYINPFRRARQDGAGNGGVGDRGERSFGGSGRRRPRPSRRCPVPSLSHGESTATDRSIQGRFRSISAELGEETVGHHPSTKRTAYRCHDEGQYDQR